MIKEENTMTFLEETTFYYETSYGGYSSPCESCGDHGETRITIEWNDSNQEVSLSGHSGCYNSFSAYGHQNVITLLEEEIQYDKKAPKEELHSIINQVNAFYGAPITYPTAPSIDIQGEPRYYDGVKNCYFCDDKTSKENYYSYISADFIEKRFEKFSHAFCYHRQNEYATAVLERKVL